MKEKTINILGIETSCDETAAAVVADGRSVRSSVVASQASLLEKYGGVVPEIASRAHIEMMCPVVTKAHNNIGGVLLAQGKLHILPLPDSSCD